MEPMFFDALRVFFLEVECFFKVFVFSVAVAFFNEPFVHEHVEVFE